MGLTQREAAELAGISSAAYKDLEKRGADYLDKETADKLAALFHVPATDFLDEYNLFLYRGQGKLIRAYCLSLGLDGKSLAGLLHIAPKMLQSWETERKRISKKSWEKFFKGKVL